MKSCSGSDRSWQASEPDWLNQADKQMSYLYATIEEINDPSLFEKWESLSGYLDKLRLEQIDD